MSAPEIITRFTVGRLFVSLAYDRLNSPACLCVSIMLPAFDALLIAFGWPYHSRLSGTASEMNRTAKRLPETEQENFNHAFLVSEFYRGKKIDNCSAQFLALCWIVMSRLRFIASATILP